MTHSETNDGVNVQLWEWFPFSGVWNRHVINYTDDRREVHLYWVKIGSIFQQEKSRKHASKAMSSLFKICRSTNLNAVAYLRPIQCS